MVIPPETHIYTINFRTLVDKRPVTELEHLCEDTFVVPGITGDYVYLKTTEVPLNQVSVDPYLPDQYVQIVDVGAGVTFTMKTSGVPGENEFVADADTYSFGYIQLSTLNAGDILKIRYFGKGSIIFASDINELADGTLIRDEAIRARHIYQDEGFTFGQDVDVLGDLNLSGDLHIHGVINKDVSEVLNTSDDILLLNSGATQEADVSGIMVERGVSGATGFDGDNPSIAWHKEYSGAGTTGAWVFKNTLQEPVLVIQDNKNVEISDGIFKPSSFAGDPALTVDMIPGIYYDSTARQLKGIVADEIGNPKIVIIG